MFSKTCEYAIRAVLYIAQKTDESRRIGIKEIAHEIGSPEHFIAKILQELSRKGIVQSAKGPNGGFYLDEQSKGQPLINIVVAVDGDKIFTGCALGLKKCTKEKPCPLHYKFEKIRNELRQMLEQAQLDSFNGRLEENLAFLKC